MPSRKVSRIRELKPYQGEGRDFVLQRAGSGLFMDMGLGKTATVLFALLDLVQSGRGPVLLVGPIRVIESVWRQEAALWPELEGLTFSLLRGAPKDRERAASVPADVYLVNPELLEEALSLLPHAKILAVDESSMFKNPSAKRFKALRKHLKRFDKRIIMTGTPAPNSLLDLWSQMFIVDLGERLGRSFYDYRNTYFEPADYMGYTWKARKGSEEEILKRISDVVFRVDAKSYLPPRAVTHVEIRFDLPPKAGKVYQSMEKEAIAKLEAEKVVTSVSAAAAMMKCRQIANGFIYDDEGAPIVLHDEKLKALEEVIEETGSPILVLYNFIEDRTALKKKFKGIVEFDSRHIDRWNRGEIPLMMLHPKSGGHGVNLQHGGHTIVVYSGSFSQEEMSQAFARVDRQGQENPVFIHHLIANGTVDEVLFETVQTKTHNQASLLERIKAYAKAHRS